MKRFILIVFFGGFLVAPLQAGSANPAPSVFIINYLVQDTSRWEIWQDFGRFTRPPGGYWPKHSGRNYLYGAGLWVGALDTTVRDTVVVRGYDCGPGGTGWGPCLPNGDTTGALTDSLARIYRSDIPRDTTQWPERDSLGRAIYYSDQELWLIASGLNPLNGGMGPVAVTCLRRSLAWNSPGPWGDITKMEFEVKNVTGRYQPPARTLKKMIAGWGVDADIGNESGTNANDRNRLECVAGSPYPNLAVQYQTATEGGWGPPGPPYQVGFRFVEGPVNNTRDTIRVRSQPGYGYPEYDHDVLPGQPLGMTAFQIFDIAEDPSTPGQCYLELSGRNYRNPTIQNSYQRDITNPGDRRFLMSCGPFDLPNDSVAKFVIHIIGAVDSLDLIRKAELLGVEAPPGPAVPKSSGVVLYPCIPNPSSGPFLVRYALPEPSPVSLKVYDISGRLIRELDGGKKPAGSGEARWNGCDDRGRRVPAGVYFYRLEAGGLSRSRSVVVLQ